MVGAIAVNDLRVFEKNRLLHGVTLFQTSGL
jgi:hypothetical protein